MRTSKDVINRVRFDTSMAPHQITIGYYDRILNKILERPFLAFSNWGKIEFGANDQLSVPMHRIQYFKHTPTGTLLWDRDTRTDRIFQSTATDTSEVIDVAALFQKSCSERRCEGSKKRRFKCPTPLQRYLNEGGIYEYDAVKALFKGDMFGRCKVKEKDGLYLVLYVTKTRIPGEERSDQPFEHP